MIDDLNCTVFIDANLSERDDLLNLIKDFIKGSQETVSFINNEYLEVSVKFNEEWAENKKKKLKGGFLYYKFYMEIAPQEGVTSKTYIDQLKALINYLRDQGFKVIPSCDYEDELNEGKHYTEWMK